MDGKILTRVGIEVVKCLARDFQQISKRAADAEADRVPCNFVKRLGILIELSAHVYTDVQLRARQLCKVA